jgi:hypothetical protein
MTNASTLSIELEALCGLRWLSARGEFIGAVQNLYNDSEQARVVVLCLDELLYWFQENPTDGYRSSLSHVRLAEPTDIPAGALIEFPKRLVSCAVRTQPDEDVVISTSDRVLMGTDEATGRVLFEIGTANIDDYYPTFISHWSPPPL